MLIDYETLRTKATTVVMIPDHYRLEMEDNTPKGDEKYRSFIWEDPEKNDCKIEVVLDLEAGDLIRLDIDMEDKNTGNQDNSEEDAKAIADAFLMKHNPDHTAFTWVNIEERQNFRFITYREEVGGLPLPDTGCEITLDNSLNIIRYRSEQKTAPRPKWPDSIVDAKNVRQQVLSDLQMKLTMVTLYPSMYEMEGTKPEYRLVYEAIPAHRLIDAITGVDHFGIEHYLMPPSHPITPMERDNTSNLGGTLTLEESEKGKMPLNLDHPSEGLIKNIAAWELLLGIDPKLYMLEKSKDDDERIELLYKLKGKVGEGPEPEVLSVDAYMKRKWGDSLRKLESSFIIQIEKSTGRLARFFHWTEEEKETAATAPLTRKQCWEKAEQFLQHVFPDYTSYLQLEVNQENMDEELRDREFFYLPVYINNIPVNHERVMISVSTSTGKICSYIGVSYEEILERAERNFYPVLTPEKAFDRYNEHVSIQLKWFKDLDENSPVYRLLYEPTTTCQADALSGVDRNRELKYIDACSGELIWQKV
ncbi:YcdB/YcdC domain-containing protein [Aneurinibacillus migulanus]|uniref:YcdB/YcdC domain-containing protein n=1 Tax=Aneurinibacillus migulanus TaxID=47500 RepID=UPI00209E56A1|nr:YcdB/YcdC domain-containing protein [Aneurinibacillus migulanus]MCP1359098.1 DUF4901 domain-containing protein [Aneurinibacillus migulanus]